jgi:excisionase family DNA binding protein
MNAQLAASRETTELPAQPAIRLLLTVPEAARALGLCRSVVYELLLCGDLRSVKIGRARRIPLSVLEDFVARRLGAVDTEQEG